MAMADATWDSIDTPTLRINQALSTTNNSATEPTLTANTVTPSQIETMSFLKYVYLSLLDKAHFLQFYNLLLTQATEYNIFLRPANNITPADSVIPDNMDKKCTQMLG